MKAIVSACAVVAIGALSTFSYAPPAHAARFCQGILDNCPAGQQAQCQEQYWACVEAGGNPVTGAPPMKTND